MTRISIWILGFALASCTDTTTTCPQSVAAYCATSSLPCPMTWTAAQDPASWGGCGTRTANSNPLVLKSCANIKVVEMWGVDASTNYTYDASTGELVSLTGHRVLRFEDTCIAGEPIPTCDDPAPVELCP